MIDTIVLRIHGYEKYSHLVKYLEQINTNAFTKKFAHQDLQGLDRAAIFYSDTDRILPLKHRSSINIPSSHYTVSFDLNKERDFIEFNFSIPKYLYSTNVMQFIDHHDTGPRHTFDKYVSFVGQFFNQYLHIPPDMADVEVNRIDLCFNQFFLSKGDALRYLYEQRNLNIHFARSATNTFNSYGLNEVQTIYYKTDNYSFKIYHKGTEFRRNDHIRLIKYNPKKFDLNELANTADKVLRYEMTCRKGLLNYLFKQRLKDDENTMFHHNLSMIRQLRNKARNNFIRALNQQQQVVVSAKDPVEVFIHKTLPNKQFSFHMHSDWDLPNSRPLQLLDNYRLGFNYELFTHLHDFFWERVKKYQLGVKMGIQDIYQKIKDHQQETELKKQALREAKGSQTGQLLLIATLSQYTDISDLKTVLPKATYYRYRKKLEDLGIPQHSPDIAVQPPALDYVTYFYYFGHMHMTYN